MEASTTGPRATKLSILEHVSVFTDEVINLDERLENK
jgi:hypothetical protein